MFGNNYYPPAPQLSNSQFNAMGNNSGVMSAFNQGSSFGSRGGGGFGGSGLGFNMDTLQLGLGGLSAVGNFWNAYQANSLAKKQFNFTKQMTEANYMNSMKSYNTALEDRARARGVTEGQSQDQVQSYIDKNRLEKSY